MGCSMPSSSGSWKCPGFQETRVPLGQMIKHACQTQSQQPYRKGNVGVYPEKCAAISQYIMDPVYCHVYTVDLSPFIFDASIGGTPGANRY